MQVHEQDKDMSIYVTWSSLRWMIVLSAGFFALGWNLVPLLEFLGINAL